VQQKVVISLTISDISLALVLQKQKQLKFINNMAKVSINFDKTTIFVKKVWKSLE